MSTAARTHPWWVAGLAALAAAATVGVLALAGAFDNDPVVVEEAPVVVVKPTTGGIDQANAQREERLLQHGVAVSAVGVTGDTKDDLFASKPKSQLGHGAAGYGARAGTPATGQELVLGDRAPGAGH
jgi:hypothetical protein